MQIMYDALLKKKHPGQKLSYGETAWWANQLLREGEHYSQVIKHEKIIETEHYLSSNSDDPVILHKPDPRFKEFITNAYLQHNRYAYLLNEAIQPLPDFRQKPVSPAVERYKETLEKLKLQHVENPTFGLKYKLLAGLDLHSKDKIIQRTNFGTATGLNPEDSGIALGILRNKALEDQISRPSFFTRLKNEITSRICSKEAQELARLELDAAKRPWGWYKPYVTHLNPE